MPTRRETTPSGTRGPACSGSPSVVRDDRIHGERCPGPATGTGRCCAVHSGCRRWPALRRQRGPGRATGGPGAGVSRPLADNAGRVACPPRIRLCTPAALACRELRRKGRGPRLLELPTLKVTRRPLRRSEQSTMVDCGRRSERPGWRNRRNANPPEHPVHQGQGGRREKPAPTGSRRPRRERAASELRPTPRRRHGDHGRDLVPPSLPRWESAAALLLAGLHPCSDPPAPAMVSRLAESRITPGFKSGPNVSSVAA